MSEIGLRPTIRCMFCDRSATYVCSHPKCLDYPFLCGGECSKNPGITSMHMHNNAQTLSIIPVDVFIKRLDNMGNLHSQRQDQRKYFKSLDRQFSKIKDSLEQLKKRHLEGIERMRSKSPKCDKQKIMEKINRPSSIPDTKGNEIYYLFYDNDERHQDHHKNRHKDDHKDESEESKRVFSTFMERLQNLLDKGVEGLGKQTLRVKDRRKDSKSRQAKDSKESKEKKHQPEEIHKNQRNQTNQKREPRPRTNNCENPILIDDSREQEHDRKRVATLLKEARVEKNAERWSSAIDKIKQAMTLDNRNPEAFVLLGTCYEKSKKYKKDSKIFYELSLKADSFYPQAYFEIGLLHEKNKEYADAIKCFKKAIEHSKEREKVCSISIRSQFFIHMGSCQQSLDNFRDALDSYTQAISCRFRNPKPFQLRARVHAKMGNYEMAIKDITSAIEIQKYSVFFRVRADLYNRMHHYDLSRMDLDEMERLEIQEGRKEEAKRSPRKQSATKTREEFRRNFNDD